MLRSMSLLLALPLVFAASAAFPQAKKPSGPARLPSPKETAVSVNVFLKDDKQNEVLLGTRVWPDNPDYNALALQRFFATMKALEPAYRQDDNVAYTWSSKGRVTKCAIYLEAFEAGARSGTGALVGCEANGVSSVPATSIADPKHAVSSSQDPKHLADVLDLFKRQSERARGSLAKP